MNYMDELFETWLRHSKDTPEAADFLKKMSYGSEEIYDELIICLDAATRQAFEGGFDCAVQLFKRKK